MSVKGFKAYGSNPWLGLKHIDIIITIKSMIIIETVLVIRITIVITVV